MFLTEKKVLDPYVPTRSGKDIDTCLNCNCSIVVEQLNSIGWRWFFRHDSTWMNSQCFAYERLHSKSHRNLFVLVVCDWRHAEDGITVETLITHTVRWTIWAMGYQGLWVPRGQPKKGLKKSRKNQKKIYSLLCYTATCILYHLSSNSMSCRKSRLKHTLSWFSIHQDKTAS